MTDLAAFAVAVKTLIDLVENLENRIHDRKTRNLFLPVKEQALEVRELYLKAQQDRLDLERKQLASERKIDDLTSQLDVRDSQLEVKDTRPNAEFSPEIGTWFDKSSSLHYCPRCWQKNVYSPMKTIPVGWRCPACGFLARDPATPRPTPMEMWRRKDE